METSCSPTVVFCCILFLVLLITQCSARCDAPRSCAIVHNCTAETGISDLHCYNITNDTHRCGYRRELPTELGVKINPDNSGGSYKRLPDKNFKASSNSDEAKYARIGLERAWCAAGNSREPWLQIDFDIATDIERIEVKGDPKKSNWEPQTFSVSYDDGNGWKSYRNGSIFTSSPDDFCHYVFINKTRTVRIISKNSSTCFQLAVYGNPPDPEIPTVVQLPPVITTQSTAKLLDRDTLVTNRFFENYHLFAIFLGVFVFLLVFFLTYVLCWCCRRPKESEKSSGVVTSEKEDNYVPPWRTIDAKAGHGYIASQEIQEVKIAFTDEYIPPDLKKEKENPNDEKHYQRKIFSFQRQEREDPARRPPV